MSVINRKLRVLTGTLPKDMMAELLIIIDIRDSKVVKITQENN
jgi:hypothetical protein